MGSLLFVFGILNEYYVLLKISPIYKHNLILLLNYFRMRIKKLPRILALHLKRFKFVGVLNKFKKLTYRVVFPFELRLFNTVTFQPIKRIKKIKKNFFMLKKKTDDCSNSDRIYDLVSFVVHCGMGLNRGHYISVVKSHGYWFLFDDEQVEVSSLKLK